jgi:tRNA pseudouridine38-40 synthase
MKMQNYKITLSYDGTEFHGWQRQPDKKTVQSTLENSLAKIAQKKISVIGAGRTDAGVHAQAQVAHFKANLHLDEDELLRALNSLLPQDIRITSLIRAAPDFHARKTAMSKIYQYRILHSPKISPFVVRYVLHWPSALNVNLMRRAAPLFIREADFTAFSSNRLLNPVRTITRSEVKKTGNEVIYTVEANGFLRYMVRTIVGTLLEVGKGKISPEQIEELFKKNKRSLASPTAPAKGLCLIEVNY